MTQEEKQLLLEDLCARLPYWVKGRYCLYDSKGNLTDWGNEPEIVENIDFKERKIWTDDTVQGYNLDEFKPYLRPMSSMTTEEKTELKKATCPEGMGYFDEKYLICPMNHFGEFISYEFMSDILNWLNAHHFDYRGLIDRRLALEAPKDMYKTEWHTTAEEKAREEEE